jgi:hypothetical protein
MIKYSAVTKNKAFPDLVIRKSLDKKTRKLRDGTVDYRMKAWINSIVFKVMITERMRKPDEP